MTVPERNARDVAATLCGTPDKKGGIGPPDRQLNQGRNPREGRSKVRRRFVVLVGLVLLAAPVVLTRAGVRAADPPTPDPNFAFDLAPRNCLPQPGNQYEADQYAREGWQSPEYERYPGHCRRLKFAFGPLTINPGQHR